MNKTNQLIKVFTGPEASAILLKTRLEEIGISSLIKNDSGTAYLGVASVIIELYIQESDFEKAQPIIAEMNENIKD
jgi:hypothetical protein